MGRTLKRRMGGRNSPLNLKMSKFTKFIKDGWNGLKNIIDEGAKIVGDSISALAEYLGNNLSKKVESGKELVQGAKDVLSGNTEKGIENIIQSGNTFLGIDTGTPTEKTPSEETTTGETITGGTPSGGIVDTTGQNEDISFQAIYDQIAADQKAQWEREDAIRKETQAREDTAYQRAVEDMRKAGINPNLTGVTAAQSGGGVTQATGKDYSLYEAEMDKALTEMENILDRELKADENTKDRLTDLMQTVMQIGMLYLFKK